MMRKTTLRTSAVALAAVAAMAAGMAPASANDSPAGCGTPHLVNSAGIYASWGGQRIGTLSQYWGWCNGNLRNWAHVHLGSGQAWETKISIQTPDGVRHGTRVQQYGTDFTSDPTATMDRSTRARVEGDVWLGQVEPIDVATTGWSG